jgi:hypothetical protein
MDAGTTNSQAIINIMPSVVTKQRSITEYDAKISMTSIQLSRVRNGGQLRGEIAEGSTHGTPG